MPSDHTTRSSEKSQEELALEAWSLAMTQMLDAGKKAVRSGGMLSELLDDDIRIAEAEFEVVYEIDKVRLFKYEPAGKPNRAIAPVVICYGLFGRQSMIDLQEDRSLVRNLLSAGITVYVVDWGNPTRADQYLNFDDYVDLYLGSCLEHAVLENDDKPVNLFGICEGGTFAVMLAATRPELFAGLALAITPVDFHGDQKNFWLGEGFLNTWISNLDQYDIDLMIETYGMLPGAMTGVIFSSLTPINSMTKYNIGLANLDGDKDAMLNFLRMEKWIADRPDHPGELARQWLNGLYRENKLVRGEFELLGKKVDLSNIACPVLNIFAHQDHIIPVSCSKALGKFIPEDRYQEIGFPGGHVGVFVSRKAQGVVSGGLIEWLKKSAKKPASKAKSKTKSE